jgi:hypothetical protein
MSKKRHPSVAAPGDAAPARTPQPPASRLGSSERGRDLRHPGAPGHRAGKAAGDGAPALGCADVLRSELLRRRTRTACAARDIRQWAAQPGERAACRGRAPARPRKVRGALGAGTRAIWRARAPRVGDAVDHDAPIQQALTPADWRSAREVRSAIVRAETCAMRRRDGRFAAHRRWYLSAPWPTR